MAANGRWLDRAILALLLAATLLIPTGLIATPLRDDGDRAVAVLFRPGTGAGEAMQRVGDAGGRIVRFGAFPFIVVAAPDRPEFAARVRERGALMLLDPRTLAACLFGVAA